MEALYKDKTRNGLIKGHKYIVEFSKRPKQYVYDCYVKFDIDTKEEMNVLLKFASQISIKNSFDIDKLELDNE